MLGVICDRTFVETKRYGRVTGWPKKSSYQLIAAVFGQGNIILLYNNIYSDIVPVLMWLLPCVTVHIPDPIPPTDIISQSTFVV